MSVRVRFAPSPTGPLHIGGARTALFNYCFARQHNGTFILRIEDTDQARYTEGAEEYIQDALAWLGLHPDEGPRSGGEFGPYRQSERKEIYIKYALELIENGWAYYAFDTPEELEGMRAQYEAAGSTAPKYDAHIRMQMRNSISLGDALTKELLLKEAPYTIRLKVPHDQVIGFEDKIRGAVNFASEELDDKVLIKADGLPTYHLANVVDDHLMKITHVIRGEEWLSSTAHHVLLYMAFGWTDSMPEFAHLPLILKPTGQGKLSKRDGAKFGFPVFPLDWQDPSGEVYQGFREFGFLPEALINFLALLGWNPGTEQEIFDLEGLANTFSLEHVSKSGARFDFDKALWFNQQYILTKEPSDLAHMFLPFLEKDGLFADFTYLVKICEVYRERIKVIHDLVPMTRYLFGEIPEYDESAIRKMWTTDLDMPFHQLTNSLSEMQEFTTEKLREQITAFVKAQGLKMGAVFQMLRTAISGSPSGPDVFQMLELLGKEKVIERVGTCGHIFAKMQG